MSCFFFFNDTATTEIYTLSLHDALPISRPATSPRPSGSRRSSARRCSSSRGRRCRTPWRSEEHTSELQSQSNLVCRLLLEKKKEATILHIGRTARPCEEYEPVRVCMGAG